MFRRVVYGCFLTLLLLGGCERLPPIGLRCKLGSQECGEGLFCNARGICQLCDGGACVGSEPIAEGVEPTSEPAEEPLVEGQGETSLEPAQEPGVEPAQEPGVEPVQEPVVEPDPDTLEPVTEPTIDGGEPLPEQPDVARCNPGARQQCYTGAPGTVRPGAPCKGGNRICGQDGAWGECKGEITPTKEICNGKDDDCDGTIDEALYCTRVLIDNLTSVAAGGPHGMVVGADKSLYLNASYFQSTSLHGLVKINPTSTPPIALLLSTPNNGLSALHFSRHAGLAELSSAGLMVAVGVEEHVLRIIDVTNIKVDVIMGRTGVSGGDDGTAGASSKQASFAEPFAVAVDANGVIFVTDNTGQTVRKVEKINAGSCHGVSPTSDYCITTIVGSHKLSGVANGPGSTARLKGPRGIAADSTGALYIAEIDSHTIRKVTFAGVGKACPGGDITSNGYCVALYAGAAGIAGSDNGLANKARFKNPYHITIDGKDNLYVVDSGNGSVRMISSQGQVYALAGVSGGTRLKRGDSPLPGASVSFPTNGTQDALVAIAHDPHRNVLYVGGGALIYEINLAQ